jgi:hypothetical protein
MEFDPHQHRVRLTNREKKIIHWLIISAIAVQMIAELRFTLDWSWLALAVVVETS